MSEDEFWASLGLPYWAALGAAHAAFWIWLTVRIVNGRKRCVKWTAVAAIVVPVIYILSSGPMRTVAFRRHVTSSVIPGRSDGARSSETTIDPGVWWPRAYAPLF